MNLDDTRPELLWSDLAFTHYLGYNTIMGEEYSSGVPFTCSGKESLWATIEKFPDRDWFDIVFSGDRERVFMSKGDIAIIVMSDGSSHRIQFLLPSSGGMVKINRICIKEHMLVSLSSLNIDRIVLGRPQSMSERIFRPTPDGAYLFRWLVYRLWYEAYKNGWISNLDQSNEFYPGSTNSE